MEERLCRLCYVSGRVQGVFFRASTASKAVALGVKGHAINLPDGRVEVLACGPANAVDALIGWLHRGPDGARVDDVDVGPAQCDAGAPERFATG